MCQEQAGGRMQVIDRAVTLMQAIAAAPRERTAQELAGACGLNRTTAWRILVSLEHNGLVLRDPVTQRYSVGIDLVRLGEAADLGPLIQVAEGYSRSSPSRYQEQVSLGVPRHLGLSYVEHLQPSDGSPVPRWLGQSGPLHATASGKVFLSRLWGPNSMPCCRPTWNASRRRRSWIASLSIVSWPRSASRASRLGSASTTNSPARSAPLRWTHATIASSASSTSGVRPNDSIASGCARSRHW